MIRPADAEDLDALVAMGQRFIAETRYAELIHGEPVVLRETAARLLDSPEGAIFVLDNGASITGMIGLALFNHPYTGQRMATELFWWVNREARGEGVSLLEHAMEWAKAQGAALIQMVAPNARVGTFYTRLGFTPIETAYQRVL